MTITYLKKAEKTPATGEEDTRNIVNSMLAEIEAGGEARALQYAKDLDNFSGDIVVTEEAVEKDSKGRGRV